MYMNEWACAQGLYLLSSCFNKDILIALNKIPSIKLNVIMLIIYATFIKWRNEIFLKSSFVVC